MRSQKVDVVCLQETKLKGISRGVIRSFIACKFVDWVVSFA